MNVWLLVLVPVVILIVGTLAVFAWIRRKQQTPRQAWRLMQGRWAEVTHELYPSLAVKPEVTFTGQFSFDKKVCGDYSPDGNTCLKYIQPAQTVKAWEQGLDAQAHAAASAQACARRGKHFEWHDAMGICSGSKQWCQNQADHYRPPPSTGAPPASAAQGYHHWYRWIDGKCYQADMMYPFFQFCNDKLSGFTGGGKPVYLAPKVDTDGETGRAGIDLTQDAKGHYTFGPTCVFYSNYCERMGINHEKLGHTGLPVRRDGTADAAALDPGNCWESTGQAIVEMILTKTVVRTFRRNWDKMIKGCKGDHANFVSSCAVGIGRLAATPFLIAGKSAWRAVEGNWRNMNKQCGSMMHQFSAMNLFQCARSLMDWIPDFWVADKVATMMINMVKALWPQIKVGFHDFVMAWRLVGNQIAQFGREFIHMWGALGQETARLALNVTFGVYNYGRKLVDVLGHVVGDLGHDLGKAYGYVSEICDGVVATVNEYGHDVMNFLHNSVQALAGTAAAIFQDACQIVAVAAAVFRHVAEQVGRAAVQTLAKTWHRTTAAFDWMQHHLAGFLSNVGADVSQTLTAISHAVSQIADRVGQALGRAGDAIAGAAKEAGRKIAEGLQKAGRWLGNLLREVDPEAYARFVAARRRRGLPVYGEDDPRPMLRLTRTRAAAAAAAL